MYLCVQLFVLLRMFILFFDIVTGANVFEYYLTSQTGFSPYNLFLLCI